MRARSSWQVMGVGFVLGLVTSPARAGTLIDMPAPSGADVTYLAENPPSRLGAVALKRYSKRRVMPQYSYRSPSAWPSHWSGWHVGYPYGYGYGWGYGFGWGRGSWWGHSVIGSHMFHSRW